ncbi:hypothetical protein OIU76_025697 [Salix suchowensis]|nr:hypothetical protein OIU76_025697 [Salix suchowensis]
MNSRQAQRSDSDYKHQTGTNWFALLIQNMNL